MCAGAHHHITRRGMFYVIFDEGQVQKATTNAAWVRVRDGGMRQKRVPRKRDVVLDDGPLTFTFYTESRGE